MAPRHVALAVFTVLAGLFILSPLVVIVLNSFSSVAYNLFPPPGLSLHWYANMAAQQAFGAAALRSVVLALLVTVLSLAIGIMAAYALMRWRLPGSGLIRASCWRPWWYRRSCSASPCSCSSSASGSPTTIPACC